MQIFTNPNYDFVRWRWHAIALSLLVILAGLGVMWKDGVRLGVDFEGGTIVIAKFDQMPPLERIREALQKGMPGGGEAVVQQYGDAANRDVLIRVRRTGAETAGNLSQEAEAAVAALKQAGLGNFAVVGTEIVGPVVGEQLKRQGILATVLALAGILIYIAIRFQLGFAVGAVAATLHDLLVCLAFLAFFKYDITLNVIAGLLTITGYSVNDTIVVFDRVRENMRSMRRDNLSRIVNVAVNQTLARTVITAGTTLLSVLALYLFGGEVLKGFAFTMLVGIISGTYSTVFIASAIAIMFQGRRLVKGQVAPAAADAPRRTGRRRAS
ncbi:MAG TPA: protein translocase subunit SecF [Vicinamibacterales bacterium]|jgi:preprotein translocase subunit SecF|nr:protein translocase subunit SecF [Vicinamibacterales bacterium]